jgi:hypothetical protein
MPLKTFKHISKLLLNIDKGITWQQVINIYNSLKGSKIAIIYLRVIAI